MRHVGVLVLLALISCFAASEAKAWDRPDSSSDAAVREALGEYPWYDAPTDSAKRLWSGRTIDEPAIELSGWQRALMFLGRLLVYGLFIGLLVAILVFVARYMGRLEIPSDEPERRGPSRRPARAGALPLGMEVGVADPLAAAREARARGDLARAVVYLFAHELLLLERHAQVRLVAGRTGRQLVRSVGDPEIRRRVEPTLRLFEAVYYGHRSPDASQVDAAWADAESLQQLLAARVA